MFAALSLSCSKIGEDSQNLNRESNGLIPRKTRVNRDLLIFAISSHMAECDMPAACTVFSVGQCWPIRRFLMMMHWLTSICCVIYPNLQNEQFSDCKIYRGIM